MEYLEIEHNKTVIIKITALKTFQFRIRSLDTSTYIWILLLWLAKQLDTSINE